MQFVKPEELKERTNELVAENEKFNDALLNADRKIAFMKKQEDLEVQGRKIELDRAGHEAALAKIEAEKNADIEKIGYETKGVSYKELREMDREDIRTLADAEAKVGEAIKPLQDTVVVIQKGGGKCPYCDGEITESVIFCPTCKKKVI
jgi:hypothetical protein